MAIKSLLVSITNRIQGIDIISSNEQSKCYIKCYKRRTKYTNPLFWLPSNQFTRFFYKHTSLRCYGNYVSDVYPTKGMVMCS